MFRTANRPSAPDFGRILSGQLSGGRKPCNLAGLSLALLAQLDACNLAASQPPALQLQLVAPSAGVGGIGLAVGLQI